jgi:hypothetical protein
LWVSRSMSFPTKLVRKCSTRRLALAAIFSRYL